MNEKNKYSLWIVPKAEAGAQLQALTDQLAHDHNAPEFVPHLTVVANIFATPDEIPEIEEKVRELIRNIGSFGITLANFGYTEEEFRCLYLLAEPSKELDDAYQAAVALFPQVKDEHFRAMPHLSVLYGHYSTSAKEEIIKSHPIDAITISVDSFDLFLTNNPISSWQLEKEFVLERKTT